MSRPISEDLNGITAICKSADYPFCYIGTGDGLLIYEPLTDEILCKKKILYGVRRIKELRSNLISITTMDKNLLFSVQIKP